MDLSSGDGTVLVYDEERGWVEQRPRQTVDGIEMEWNDLSQQWLPVVEVDEDFLAQYQANYGIYTPQEQDKTEEKKDEATEKPVKRPREEGWLELDESKNCSIYVSQLPSTTTDEQFEEFVSKCGVLMRDPRTNKPKIKLYRDSDGGIKGDGTCCYIKIESVDLALKILHEANFNGSIVSVERAKFEMKGQFDPHKKRKRLTAAQKKRMIEQQQRIFDWKPEKPRSSRPNHERTVVVKNIFELRQFEENPSLLIDLEEEVKESCSKYGVVKKVVIYDNNPEGVVTITFESAEMADQAVRMLNNRLVDGRRLEAHLWDGETKYKVEETEEQREERMSRWAKFISED